MGRRITTSFAVLGTSALLLAGCGGGRTQTVTVTYTRTHSEKPAPQSVPVHPESSYANIYREVDQYLGSPDRDNRISSAVSGFAKVVLNQQANSEWIIADGCNKLAASHDTNPAVFSVSFSNNVEDVDQTAIGCLAKVEATLS